MARCMAQVGYARAGLPTQTNSAAAYGSIVHHAALNVLERQLREKVPFEQALAAALETFAHYWAPANIEAICEPVPADGWLPRQGYSELRLKGLDTIRKYADLIRYDDNELLATEFSFIVPLEGTWDDELGEPHWLAGAVDRLAVRHYSRVPVLAIDDLKSGKEQPHLRHNQQFTAYCLASTTREFWVGARGEDGFGEERGQELFERFQHAPRRGTWVNLRTIKFQDAGWRGPIDYERFKLAVQQFFALVAADVYPLSISGATCRYCFTGDTQAWTAGGLRRLDDLAGTTPRLLSNTRAGGGWVEAPVRSFGFSPVLSVTLARGRDTKVVRATPDHRWLVRVRKDEARTDAKVVATTQLVPGNRLLSMNHRSRLGKVEAPNPFGVAAGIVFGDGCAPAGRTTSDVDLWAESAELARYFTGCQQTTIESPNGVKGVHVSSLPRHFKGRPDLEEAASYLYGWLAGYFAADGHITASGQTSLSSASRPDLEFAQTVATRLGIFTHEIHGYERRGIDGTMSTLYKLNIALDSLREDFFLQDRHRRYYREDVRSVRSWTVVSVDDQGERAEVFCATVPAHENFVLEGFINVKNCDFRRICGGTGLPDTDHGKPGSST